MAPKCFRGRNSESQLSFSNNTYDALNNSGGGEDTADLFGNSQ